MHLVAANKALCHFHVYVIAAYLLLLVISNYLIDRVKQLFFVVAFVNVILRINTNLYIPHTYYKNLKLYLIN